MSNGFKLSTVLSAPPATIYRAWLDARSHAAFTNGGTATSEARVGGAFSAWDGYISGSYLALEPGSRLVLAWRTTDFPAAAADSRVEVLLAPARGGTRLTLVHALIPAGQEADYQAGWGAFYFTPMRKYFARGGATAPKRAQKPAAGARRKRPASKAAAKRRSPPRAGRKASRPRRRR